MEQIEQILEQYPFLKSGYQRIMTKELMEQEKAREIWVQERFDYSLHRFLSLQFGSNYVARHLSDQVTSMDLVQKNIKLLFETGIGSIYLGSPGNGKSHILLETCRQLLILEWTANREKLNIMDYTSYFEKTAQFYYLPTLCDLLRKHDPVKICRYNFLDDFGAEELMPSTMSSLNGYFEEINRRGGGVVITSNGSVSDFVNRPRFERITSRLAEICRVYTLPDFDRRKDKTKMAHQIEWCHR